MTIETHSATWDAVRKHIDAELETSRRRLEATGMALAETEYERGRIAALNGILGLTKPPLKIAPTNPIY